MALAYPWFRTVEPLSPYLPENLRQGLVLYLWMNEGSGNRVYDLSGNGNHGTIYDATWTRLASGKNALYFDGVNNYVSGSIRFPWGGVGYRATFVAWAKILPAVIPSNYTWGYGHAGIVTLASHWGGGWLGVQYLGSAGAPATQYRLLAYYYNQMVIFSVGYGFDTWLYVALVYTVLSADNVEVKVYVNGSLLATYVHSVAGLGTVTGVSSSYNLGRNNAWRGMYLKGAISGALIYNRALSDAEIRTLYELHRGLFVG